MGLDRHSVNSLAADVSKSPIVCDLMGAEVIAALILDLRDAHLEIERLTNLSASQAKAMDMIDAGTL